MSKATCFKTWLGFGPRDRDKAVSAALMNTHKTAPPDKPPMAEAVAEIMIIFATSDAKREIVTVHRVGTEFFVWPYSMEDAFKRILPHGRVGSEGLSFIAGWEPVSPVDWQPDGAETAHEAIRRLKAEAASREAQVDAAEQRHAAELRALGERLKAHERLLKTISQSAREAVA